MRIKFDPSKSEQLRRDPRRSVGFEEARALLDQLHYLDLRPGPPDQWRAIGLIGERCFTLIYEEREDLEGTYIHLVTLWPSSREERRLYEDR